MTKEQIEKHKIAAKKLEGIKNRVFIYVKENLKKASEYDVNKFIYAEFKKEGMISQKEDPSQIVAFGPNTSFVHHYPTKQKGSPIIHKNNLVLIDIWARLNETNAPYADITWMGYTGKNIPKEIVKAFNMVVGAREAVIKFLKGNLKNKKLPKSAEVDRVARDYLRKYGVEEFFKHGTGHSLGFTYDHGPYFRFSKKVKSKMKLNIPFTIEPGIYFRNKFGIRSEIDCYITSDYKLVITTNEQREIIKI